MKIPKISIPKLSKNQWMTMLGAFVVLLAFGIFNNTIPFSIMVARGITNQQGIFQQGETVYWSLDINNADASALKSQLTCPSGQSLQVSYDTIMHCQLGGSTGWTPITTSGAEVSAFPCATFGTTSSNANLNGNPHATIPANANTGDNCIIGVTYKAKMPSSSTWVTRDISTGNTELSVVSPNSVTCTPNTKQCVVITNPSSEIRQCNYAGNQWIVVNSCVYGCASQSSCNAPPVCNNNGVCTDQETNANCPNDCAVSVKTCAGGQVIPVADTCPPYYYCGDGICNNQETSASCITDCPITCNSNNICEPNIGEDASCTDCQSCHQIGGSCDTSASCCYSQTFPPISTCDTTTHTCVNAPTICLDNQIKCPDGTCKVACNIEDETDLLTQITKWIQDNMMIVIGAIGLVIAVSAYMLTKKKRRR